MNSASTRAAVGLRCAAVEGEASPMNAAGPARLSRRDRRRSRASVLVRGDLVVGALVPAVRVSRLHPTSPTTFRAVARIIKTARRETDHFGKVGSDFPLDE